MPRTFSIEDIAVALGARFEGDGALRVSHASEPARAGPEALALAMDEKFAAGLTAGEARAAMLWVGADWRAMGLEAAIFVRRPRFAMSGLTAMLDAGPRIAPGVHATAVIEEGAELGEGAAIGPFAVIGAGARIGPGARIAAHVSVAPGSMIGADCLLREGVRIGHSATIGDRFIAQPGAVVGGDGFSFVTPEAGAVEAVRSTLGERGEARQQAYVRIHSLGGVVVGDDVELGANSCIDQGTIHPTEIGSGTKIDNLVQVGHNVRTGRDCLLCGQVGIAGSTRLGDRVVLGGQAGVTDHLEIGDDVIAGAGTLLRTNQPAGRVMLGNPAMEMKASIDAYKHLRRLPRMAAQLAELRKNLSKRGPSE